MKNFRQEIIIKSLEIESESHLSLSLSIHKDLVEDLIIKAKQLELFNSFLDSEIKKLTKLERAVDYHSTMSKSSINIYFLKLLRVQRKKYLTDEEMANIYSRKKPFFTENQILFFLDSSKRQRLKRIDRMKTYYAKKLYNQGKSKSLIKEKFNLSTTKFNKILENNI